MLSYFLVSVSLLVLQTQHFSIALSIFLNLILKLVVEAEFCKTVNVPVESRLILKSQIYSKTDPEVTW